MTDLEHQFYNALNRYEEKQMTHGGKRKGAGRPRIGEADKRKTVGFKLDVETVALLKQKVAVSRRSRLVESLLLDYLKKN